MSNEDDALVPRWFSEHGEEHSRWYVDRFRTLAREGADLEGEARLVDALVAPNSFILDAGCGPGRVGGALFERGHRIVGVDVDPLLISAAKEDHVGPTWILGDLSTLDLGALGVTELFDAAVIAGNVMTYLAPGTASEVLSRVGSHLAPHGRIAVGFGTGRGYELDTFDRDARDAQLRVEHRFGTWDLRPWSEASDFSVSILIHDQP